MGSRSVVSKAAGTDWRRGIAVVGLAVLPLATVLVLRLPPGALAGCGTYGYGCSQPACFVAEISTNQGGTWQRGSAWIYGPQGSEIDLWVRTTLWTSVNHVEGWSFGLKHSAPTLVGVQGGDFYPRAAQAGPGVATVQAGSPADFQSTQLWDCGVTQGVVVDVGGPITTGPNAGLVIGYACYRLKFPYNKSVHQVQLEFTDDVGTPAVENMVSRNAQALVPCKETLTLNVYPSSYYPTPSYCPCTAGTPAVCEGMERVAEGGPRDDPVEGCIAPVPVMMFQRGDGDANGGLEITDAIFLLNHLFLGGDEPTCMDAADVDDTGGVNITDPIYLLTYLYLGGSSPPPPTEECDLDPTSDALGCGSFAPCADTVLTGPNVSQRAGDQGETAVAVNPCQPMNVVVVANDLPKDHGLFRAVSFDGGEHWPVHGLIADTGDDRACCDPSLAFDAFGNLHLAYLGEDGHIHNAASTDGGVTFPADLHGEILDGSLDPPSSPGADRPTISTGPAFDDPNVQGDEGEQSVWVSFHAQVGPTTWWIVAAGATIDGPLDPLGPPPEYTWHVVDEGAVLFADVAIGGNGEAMVAYQEHVWAPQYGTPPADIFLKLRGPARTDDMNASFAFPTAMPIATSNVCGSPKGGQRANAGDSLFAISHLEWDRQANKVYLAYLEEPYDTANSEYNEKGELSVDTDVFLTVGTGPSFTGWSPPAVVFEDPGTQLHFDTSLDRASGRLGVSWYGTEAPTDSTFEYFVTCRDEAAGRFLPPRNLTSDPPLSICRSGQVATGWDYTALAFAEGSLVPCWPDNSPGAGCFDNQGWDVIVRRIETEDCDNSEDDDGDFLTDCFDPDCCGHDGCGPCEDCDDGVDNDGDSDVDCWDTDCAGLSPGCQETDCDDSEDDDGDGLTDCDDSDCAARCWRCDNGLDDDSDGLTDCDDPDCVVACE